MLVAQFAVFLQSFVDDVFELGRNIWVQPDGRDRNLVKNRVEQVRRRVTAEGQRASSHFVQNGSEREQIGAGIEILAARLLGRHVGNCADGSAGAGQMVRLDRCLRGSKRTARAGCYFGQSEIENLGVSTFGHKNVRRLDVPVNDVLGMGGVERVSDLDGQREQGIEFERMARDHMLQRRAIQKLHDDERLAILFANVVDGADVGMVERRGRFRLPAKPFKCLMVAGHVFRQKLEGHKPVEAGVLRFVNHTHAPATELRDDAVVRDGLADHCLSDHVGPTEWIGDRGIGK